MKVSARGGGVVGACTVRPGEEGWLVNCHEESGRRLIVLNSDEVMRRRLDTLRGIPHLLVPRKILSVCQYIADSPLGERGLSCGEGAWFCAGELNDLRVIRQKGMTVGTLWRSAASLCGTLRDLWDVGVWGRVERGAVLLRSDGEICLTGAADLCACRHLQSPQQEFYAGEDPKTTALRTLLGGLALCVDDPTRDANEADSPLEIQLGRGCAGALSTFFRTPSELSPERFLENAKDILLFAAEHLCWGRPRKLRLYIVLLGGDCRQVEIPALSSVARCFCRCVGELCGAKLFPLASTVLIYPWDGVEICELDPAVIPGVSALPSGEPQKRPVLLGGLLDSLDQELERNMEEGGVSLVCYIDLQTAKGSEAKLTLNCMERYLLEKLGRKRRLGAVDSFLCIHGDRKSVV